jgi:hypothetical protein
MRHLITLLSAVAAATILVVGCSSSSDSGPASTGGSGGGSSDAQCVGDYADLKQSAFNAQVMSAGKCASSSDETAVCVNDVTSIAETCGDGCFMTVSDKSAAPQDACTSTCLGSMVTPALSSDCQSCYVADVACARANCLIFCGTDPGGSGCMTCRQMNGCIAAFYACSGLPIPAGTSLGAGGAGGEPSASAGAGN